VLARDFKQPSNAVQMLGGKRQIAPERATQQFAEVRDCAANLLTPRIIAPRLRASRRRKSPQSTEPGRGRHRYGCNRADEQDDVSHLHTGWIAHDPPYLPMPTGFTDAGNSRKRRGLEHPEHTVVERGVSASPLQLPENSQRCALMGIASAGSPS